MIKFRIRPKFRSGRGVNLGKCKKCQNYRFLDTFLDILHKLKRILGQKHVTMGPLSFQGKNWANFSVYSWKNDGFYSFALLFHPSFP